MASQWGCSCMVPHSRFCHTCAARSPGAPDHCTDFARCIPPFLYADSLQQRPVHNYCAAGFLQPCNCLGCCARAIFCSRMFKWRLGSLIALSVAEFSLSQMAKGLLCIDLCDRLQYSWICGRLEEPLVQWCPMHSSVWTRFSRASSVT